MGGLKRSLVAAALLVTGASGYLFPVPSPSALSTTSTGQAISERRATRIMSAAQTPPSPRMASTTSLSEQQSALPRRVGTTATTEAAKGASSFDVISSSSSSSNSKNSFDVLLRTSSSTPTGSSSSTCSSNVDIDSRSGSNQLDSEPPFAFPSVTRLPPPGIVARDGTRDDGGRGRDDGKGPDFEVNLGNLVIALRKDYPRFFTDPPQFDVYTQDIELRDPTGVAFRGISNYKRVFATLRFFRQIFMKDQSTTFRLTYDSSKQQVRVNWRMILQFKARQRPVYVDAISAYHVNNNGFAYRHELETVIVNGTPVEPPFAYAWVNLPSWVSRGAGGKPVGVGAIPIPNGIMTTPHFEKKEQPSNAGVSALLRAAQYDPELRGDIMTALSMAMTVESLEFFGLAGAGASGDKTGSGDNARGNNAVATPAPKQKGRVNKGKKDGWFGLQAKLECETSFDCSGGLVCCDLFLVKVCCNDGIRQPKLGGLMPSLTPIPGRGRNDDDSPLKRRSNPRQREGIDW